MIGSTATTTTTSRTATTTSLMTMLLIHYCLCYLKLKFSCNLRFLNINRKFARYFYKRQLFNSPPRLGQLAAVAKCCKSCQLVTWRSAQQACVAGVGVGESPRETDPKCQWQPQKNLKELLNYKASSTSSFMVCLSVCVCVCAGGGIQVNSKAKQGRE